MSSAVYVLMRAQLCCFLLQSRQFAREKQQVADVNSPRCQISAPEVGNRRNVTGSGEINGRNQHHAGTAAGGPLNMR